ncbi:unnamed protein product [Acanthosepion pharaonis]|uniref:DUF7041 domain-containing protein n=1 Tax=Acanthosepion pharaonis TaxID=158019 RepID=A0A812E6J5_ACAPH|nr:unnamed protein product [Sepia pharaonis]
MPLANLPTYNEQNTKNWFLQLEAIFSVRRIASQQSKFTNIVQVLPPKVVDEVADILENVPEQEPYTRLKDAILKRTGRSDEDLLWELFTHVTRGDRTPSQLLRFMRSRLRKHSMAKSILRELWMDKLPTTITQILAPIAENTPLDQLADSADRIAAKLDQGVCAVRNPDDTPAKSKDLEEAMAEPTTVSETAIKLEMPAFNANVQTWFLQLDAIFQARRITSQQSKFAAVVEKLPAEIAAEVADILTSVPVEKPYEILKEAILHRSGFSEEKRIRELLSNVTTEDAKPSQLLRRMQQLLGENDISTTVFKQMWLDKLPPEVTLLTPSSRNEPVRHHAKHSIKTTGFPVYSQPRRLHPAKLKIARDEFDNMLRLGIIRPSKSPYASPLHMVTKSRFSQLASMRRL